MQYTPQNWKNLCFFITPEELKQVVSEYHLLICDRHVPIDYAESEMVELLGRYERIYDLLTSGKKLNWHRDHELLQQYGLASDFPGHSYGREHVYQGEWYKSAEFEEPVVHISPCTLYFLHDGKGKLTASTAFNYVQNPEFLIGYKLQYPGRLQYFSEEEWGPQISTEEMRSYADFVNMRNSIMKVTKPLKICIEGTQRRLGVRVSPRAKEAMKEFWYFRDRNIQCI